MSEVKDRVLKLIIEGDLSAIEIISDKVGVDSDRTRQIIQDLVQEGKLRGKLTDDGSRFFKEEVVISDAPSISTEDEAPDFLDFNPRPGQIVAVIGAIVFIIGLIGTFLFYGNLGISNSYSVLSFMGLAIMFCGCYYLGSRKTPM